MAAFGESDSEDFFDVLAPHYREYCDARADYLAAVDRVVIQRIPSGATSLLDVGAGDGLRAAGIAEARGIPVLVLVEPSRVMAEYCEQRRATEVWRLRAEDLRDCDRRFDVITCLWNVLGHVADTESRLATLRNMRSLLAEDGRIFLDVNNRYNARAYGWTITVGRVLYDLLVRSEANGDVRFEWRLDGKVIEARGHVFAPKEISRLIKLSGLRVERRFVVDYETGKLRRRIVEGQLLFELRASE